MYSQTTAGVLPVKHQIADWLRAQIDRGEFEPGDPLPTIEELSARWNCAPGIAREAVDILKGEGRISSGRGKRAVVRAQPRRIKLSMDWSQEQKDLVLRPRSERAVRGAIEMTSGVQIDDVVSTHDYDVIAADKQLSQEFGITEDAPLQRRTYEMTDPKTGHRLSFSVSYIPLTLIEANPDLLDAANEPWPGGHQHQLYTVGIELDRFVRSVIAVQPTPGDRQKWGMEEGVALLRVRTQSVDTAGRVVEMSDAVYPADRTEIVFTEQLTRWPADHKAFDPEKERA